MIRFENIGLRYGVGDEVLRDINFKLERGSFNFLTGPSGAGKTSLMRLMYLGRTPTRGLITMFGKNINGMTRSEIGMMRQKIGVVFQEFRLLPHLSVFDNVALPLRITETPEKEIQNNVNELLDWVGLGDHKDQLPETLSGGQQQRVAIARAVIARPKLLLADEPTGNLDDTIGVRLMNLLEQLNRMGTTIVVATHNQGMMNQFGHPRLILEQGQLHVQEPQTWIRDKIEGVY
ncbi:MAG: cell division ATP-binding protein FtsE [Alphaproteobacteria bacterium]|nr:cell division ATP-binding protein FtsE [Alphaproteobacteria bacterium]